MRPGNNGTNKQTGGQVSLRAEDFYWKRPGRTELEMTTSEGQVMFGDKVRKTRF